MNCLLLLFILLFSNGVTVELQFNKEPDEIVQEVIDRFNKIVETSIDLTEKLKLIKDTSAVFLKLAVPLGALLAALLAASLDIVGKPESEEYKALKKLNQQMNYQFDRLGERITYSFEAEEMDTELREFQDFITGQLNVLSRKIRYFTDPTKAKGSDSVEDLLSYCRGDNGVEKMADYIKRHVTEGCELNNTLVFVKVENLWLQLEQKFNVTEWSRHERHLKRRVLEIIYSISSQESLRELKRVESRLSGKCLTDAVFNGNQYDRVKISFFEALIQIELGRLMMSVNVCGKFIFPSDMSLFEEFLLNVGTNIVEVSQFLIDYIPKKLNISSSGVEGLIVSKIIKNYPGGQGDIPYNKYHDLGRYIHETLKHIGLERIEKQILVTPSENSDPKFTAFYVCPNYWCSTVLGQRGVDVMISRFLKRQIFYAWSLDKRRECIQPSIVELLKVDYFVSLPRLVDELETKKNVTLMAEWTRSAAVIRHKTSFSVNCEYPSIPQEYRRERTHLPATAYFKYSNFRDKGWFDDNTCHHFFFFL